MRISILGGGPAGLYLAYLLQRKQPGHQVEVYEQNAPDATFGFGIAFSDRALDFLRRDDPDTYEAILPAMEQWRDSILYLKGQEVRIDGMNYAGIGRLALLKILQARARAVGIEPQYQHTIKSLDELGSPDLIVGADGANSLVRRTHQAGFGTATKVLNNHFAWYGTSRHFEALGHTFVENEMGTFNAHFHPHAPDMSTFVVEVDDATFKRAGFDRMTLEEARQVCEKVFAEALDGHPMIANNSIWRQFPRLWNEHWSVGNCVLMGDALRTAHFSIGSGTRLAMEDALALEKALGENGTNVRAALAAYEADRKPISLKIWNAANISSDWYEHFPEHMKLDPLDFAHSYIMRSGRMDMQRLEESSPGFVSRYRQERGDKAPVAQAS